MHPLSPLPPLSLSLLSPLLPLFLFSFYLTSFSCSNSASYPVKTTSMQSSTTPTRSMSTLSALLFYFPLFFFSSSSLLLLPHFFLVFQSGIIVSENHINAVICDPHAINEHAEGGVPVQQ
jgi:hypothetical protein